jgi:hypothetical protein
MECECCSQYGYCGRRQAYCDKDGKWGGEGLCEIDSGVAWQKGNAAVNLATAAMDRHIVVMTSKEAVRGFAKLIQGLACQNGIAAANMAIAVLGWIILVNTMKEVMLILCLQLSKQVLSQMMMDGVVMITLILHLQPSNQVWSQHMVRGVVTMMILHLKPRSQVLSQQMDGVATIMMIPHLQLSNKVPSQLMVDGVVMIMMIHHIQLWIQPQNQAWMVGVGCPVGHLTWVGPGVWVGHLARIIQRCHEKWYIRQVF